MLLINRVQQTQTYGSQTYSSYETEPGQHGSTTGTIYGIYDMAGGAWEFCTAYLNDGDSELITTLNGWATKYKQAYTASTTDPTSASANYSVTATKKLYGNALWETSNRGDGDSDNSYSWNGDWSVFPTSGNNLRVMGGAFYSGSKAGLFAIYTNTGTSASKNVGFRPAIWP